MLKLPPSVSFIAFAELLSEASAPALVFTIAESYSLGVSGRPSYNDNVPLIAICLLIVGSLSRMYSVHRFKGHQFLPIGTLCDDVSVFNHHCAGESRVVGCTYVFFRSSVLQMHGDASRQGCCCMTNIR